jgi:hypothetical protein
MFISTIRDGNSISYSLNGTTWSSAVLIGDCTIGTLRWLSSEWFIFGKEYPTNNPAIFSSKDGILWSQRKKYPNYFGFNTAMSKKNRFATDLRIPKREIAPTQGILAPVSFVIDCNFKNFYFIIGSGSTTVTMTFINGPPPYLAPYTITLIIQQDANGSNTITWDPTIQWGTYSPVTLSTASNSIDIFTLYTINGGTTWYGTVKGQGYTA